MGNHRSGKYFFSILLLLLLTRGNSSVTMAEDWLHISGEKGFSFNYFSTSEQDDLASWNDGFSFSQSLLLELEGEFGKGYTLQGRIADLPNAPGQLFLELRGEHAGLRFGDGNLNTLATPLTTWNNDYNGLAAYLRNQNSQLNLVYANPLALAYQESLTIKAGRNYTYLSYQPIREGSLRVAREGTALAEGVDYLIDYYTGKLELLFYPERDLKLDLEYEYSISEVLGNQFIALSGRSDFGNYWVGGDFFTSQTKNGKNEELLGETRQPAQFNQGGLNLGFKTDTWRWDLEYRASLEEQNGASWSYFDNMEGSSQETDAFVGSTDPLNWFAGSTGSGRINLDNVSPFEDLQHTREDQPGLRLDYQLQRNGDTVFIFHDWGEYRDLSLMESLNFWVFENGQDLRVQIQLVTNENSYYYYNVGLNNLGWTQIKMPLNIADLQTVGLPDLTRVRYLKLVFSSPLGDALSGQLYLAPLELLSRSSAEQRWSEIAVAPGCSLQVSTVAEAVAGIGQPDDNHVLELNFNSTSGDGWASASYHPFAIIDASRYHSLKLLLQTNQAVKVSLSSSRGDESVLLGEVDLEPSGWREYTFSLAAVSQRMLERIESLTLKVSGPTSALVKADALRLDGRTAEDAGAVKLRGQYQSGQWSNRFDLFQYNPGFRDLSKSYNYLTQNIRNVTEYRGEEWRFHSDLETFRDEDSSTGYPLTGQRFELGLGRAGSNFKLSRKLEESDQETEPGLSGERLETRIEFSQDLSNWNLGYKRRYFEDSLSGSEDGSSDSLAVRYQRDFFWATGQLWRELNDHDNLDSLKNGLNFAFGFDPPGKNHFQINSGTVHGRENDTSLSNYFYQSDLVYALTDWITFNGKFKDFQAPEGERDGLTKDRQTDLSVLLTPLPTLNILCDQRWRDWTLLASGPTIQYTQEYQANFIHGSTKVTSYLRMEELTADLGVTEGLRYGLSGELSLWKPWLTQFSIESNHNSGANELLDTNQASYKIDLKNTFPGPTGLFYWGAWAEASATNEDWERRMLQLGYEERWPNGWNYGLKLDLGREDSLETNDRIWGVGGFIGLNNAPYYLRFILRRQTYADLLWSAGIDLRVAKSDFFSFNLHGDYRQEVAAPKDLFLRADLLFYLR